MNNSYLWTMTWWVSKRNYNEKRLDFTTDAKMAIDFSNVIFSAVWTPPDKENAHKADLKFVKQIATTLWQNMNSYKVLINKSTVPFELVKFVKIL